MRYALVAILLAGCSGFQWGEPEPPKDPVPLRHDLTLETVIEGLQRPLLVVPHGDTVLVVEQSGRVADLDGAVWADLSDRVARCHNEQGLLGLAFDPDDPELAFVAYTAKPCDGSKKGDLRLSSIQGGREQILLTLPQPYRNHNGGHVLFGPDGMLYVGIGDGGDHGDPERNGQNPGNWFGTILRLDVRADGYDVPADNPFVAGGGAPEVYVYGLRNPWRFAFDDAGGLYIADVGQDNYEEVTYLPPGQIAGANLGWSLFEGTHRFRAGSADGLVFPTAEYSHAGGHCSITGGPVLSTDAPADLAGVYLYGDFCSGRLWALHPDGTVEALMDTGLQITGFGLQDDVYITHWGGSVHRLVVADGMAANP